MQEMPCFLMQLNGWVGLLCRHPCKRVKNCLLKPMNGEFVKLRLPNMGTILVYQSDTDIFISSVCLAKTSSQLKTTSTTAHNYNFMHMNLCCEAARLSCRETKPTLKLIWRQFLGPRFARVVIMYLWEILHELKLSHDVTAVEII